MKADVCLVVSHHTYKLFTTHYCGFPNERDKTIISV